uniref:Uncharacterized protein n=1 Tax=uncultured marine virus TaxID=186617 RepID=A0A0F7L5W3_9VIRU|nr:hypothetical protein [uncultured marine virus]
MKDCEINSKALIRNLECGIEKLKKGATLGEALNEAELAYGRMHQDDRDRVRETLTPIPSRKYEKMLDRTIQKYGNRG